MPRSGSSATAEAIPIPVTALLGVVLCAVLEAAPPPEGDDTAADVVFGFFVDDNLFLFIGSFDVIGAVLSVVGVAVMANLVGLA